MNSVNQTCESIIRQVTTSCLDFNMHQTPYSLHFSIRKKYSRNVTPDHHQDRSSSSLPESSKNQYLHQELLKMRNEYSKVFNFYQVEMTERMNLEDELKEKAADIAQLQADLKRLVEEKILREEIAHQQNKFKVENKKLHENYENKCLEIKHL